MLKRLFLCICLCLAAVACGPPDQQGASPGSTSGNTGPAQESVLPSMPTESESPVPSGNSPSPST
jgi:hypothetical protein